MGRPSPDVLTLELERLSLYAVRRVYEDLNETLFDERLRFPAFALSNAEGRLGRWSGRDRTLAHPFGPSRVRPPPIGILEVGPVPGLFERLVEPLAAHMRRAFRES